MSLSDSSQDFDQVICYVLFKEVQAVERPKRMWWMDETDDTQNPEIWLKEEEDVEELLNTTEDDKKRFFETLKANGIQPEFTADIQDDVREDKELLDSINDLTSQIEQLSNDHEEQEYSMDFTASTKEDALHCNQIDSISVSDKNSINSKLPEDNASVASEISRNASPTCLNQDENVDCLEKDNLESNVLKDQKSRISTDPDTSKSHDEQNVDQEVMSETSAIEMYNNSSISSENYYDESLNDQRLSAISIISEDKTPTLSCKRKKIQILDEKLKKRLFNTSNVSISDQPICATADKSIEKELVGDLGSASEPDLSITYGHDLPQIHNNTVNQNMGMNHISLDESTIILESKSAHPDVEPIIDTSNLITNPQTDKNEIEIKQDILSEKSADWSQISLLEETHDVVLSNPSNVIRALEMAPPISSQNMQYDNSFHQSPIEQKTSKKSDKHEAERLQKSLLVLESQMRDLELDLAAKEKDNESLRKESALLESILAKEQVNSKRLLTRIGGVNHSEINQLRKEIEDQERLIHGVTLFYIRVSINWKMKN